MIKRIVSIAGKPGLYSLVSQGKNMLIVEALGTKKRMPVYAHDKVVSLGDVSIYTLEGDIPLGEVLQKVYDKAEGKAVDPKGFADDAAVRAYFEEVLPEFDRDRVYTTDIKKLLQWYNIMLAAGITEFADKPEEKAEDTPAEASAAE